MWFVAHRGNGITASWLTRVICISLLVLATQVAIFFNASADVYSSETSVVSLTHCRS